MIRNGLILKIGSIDYEFNTTHERKGYGPAPDRAGSEEEKEYPKTYEECCKILGFLNVDLCFNADYRSFDASKEQWKRLGLMNQFYQLLICRDAYWKIEEMGLGKPWEPDCNDSTTHKFIIYTVKNKIHCGASLVKNNILAFPTEEMRDAFKENFDPDIEICKEFL